MIRDRPWLGLGLDQFLYQYAPRYVDPAGWAERYTSHPHNIVLDVWLRFGIPGLGLFLTGFIVLILWTIRLREGGTERPVLAIAAASFLAAGIAHGLVDNGFFLPDLAVLTWMGIAF